MLGARGPVRACVRAWVCAHVCSGRACRGRACVCVRCARVCPACAQAWRRRARDPAAVVRARRSARPPAGAQHRLRPGVCMRGVSERVGGPGGVGCGEQPRGAAVPRTPWHRAQPPGPKAKRGGSWGRPATPSPTAGRGPGGCGRGGEGVSGGACRRPGRAPRPPSRVRTARGGRGRAGPLGGRPAALEESREQKETATAPPWSKQPALAAAQGRAAASEPSALTPSPPLPPSCAWLEAAGTDPPRGAGKVRARCGLPAAAGRRWDGTQARCPLLLSTARVLPPRPLSHLDSG